jgi:RNA polymerase sigma factor (TIGR02999 family)
MTEAAEITELLNAANAGDSDAREAAYAAVYEELMRRARNLRRRSPDVSLTATELVHELFLRLDGARAARIASRAHFYALAARAMRQIVVDHARRRQSRKRGGQIVFTGGDRAGEIGVASAEQALELDAALTELTRHDADLARVVEWHFFAGLSFREIGAELHRHERTVFHDWELARAWLKGAMRDAATA